MKEGFIVWNESNYESEFYGVYRTFGQALEQLRKVTKAKFGKCPRSYEDIIDFLTENEDDGDSLKITAFRENKGDK